MEESDNTNLSTDVWTVALMNLWWIQVWVKSPEVLARDRLLGSFKVGSKNLRLLLLYIPLQESSHFLWMLACKSGVLKDNNFCFWYYYCRWNLLLPDWNSRWLGLESPWLHALPFFGQFIALSATWTLLLLHKNKNKKKASVEQLDLLTVKYQLIGLNPMLLQGKRIPSLTPVLRCMIIANKPPLSSIGRFGIFPNLDGQCKLPIFVCTPTCSSATLFRLVSSLYVAANAQFLFPETILYVNLLIASKRSTLVSHALLNGWLAALTIDSKHIPSLWINGKSSKPVWCWSSLSECLVPQAT